MGFGEAGAALGGAIETYQKQKRIREFVERQLSRLPPEKRLEAQAILQPQASQSPLPASTMMDGVSDVEVPPFVSGTQLEPQPIDDFLRPPTPQASRFERPQSNPAENELRMLLEATRDDIVEPKTLFDYISNMGKQQTIGSNRMDIESLKAQVRQELQTTDLQARLDRLEKILENKTANNNADNQTSTENNRRNNETRLTATDRTNATRVDIAGKTNATREKIAGGKGSGKEANPDTMTPEEIDAELGVIQSYSDSLNTAGTDPKSVGYKPAEEKYATIDEGARQKDLSKAQARITALKAAKARKQVGPGGAESITPSQSGGKVYTNKSDIKADLANGVIPRGAKVQFKMPDGSTVLVNTGK